MTNWTNIHKDFGRSWGEHLKEQWKSNGFNYQQAKSWIKDFSLLKPREYDFAWWLANKQDKSPEQLNNDEIEKLREQLKQEWKDVSPDWNLEIQAEVTKWIKKDFTALETKQWLEFGLTLTESNFADYLKKKNCASATIDLEEVRKEYNEKNSINAQEWLDQNYPLGERTNLKILNIGRNNLKDSLQLKGFNNLEELYCYDNKLTILNCSDCSQLRIIRCQKNNLTNLNLTNCFNITELYCNKNQITDLNFLNSLSSEKLKILLIANNNFSASDLTSFARFTNLQNLGLGNWFKEYNNRFSGSLEPLKKLTSLEDLDIAGTDIDSGLEYLSENIQVFYCFTSEKLESKAELIAKELRKYGESEKDDDGDENFANSLKTWRGFFDSPAQKWLDKEYSEEERKISYLDISKKELKKALKLEGFNNLERLNCSNNQLTELDLSDCPNLIDLNCANNELSNLNFLESVDKLEKFSMQNNQNFSLQNLRVLAHLQELRELNISDCSFEGSLKPFERMAKLERIFISRTHISEGLEDLPTSCQELHCDLDYGYKSLEIIKELNKSKCSEKIEDGERNHIKYYDLTKWRENRENDITSSVVPLERLYVIRSNIKSFVDKWKRETEKNKISKLLPPEQWRSYGLTTESIRWAVRLATVASSVGGSALTLTDHKIAGGVITATGAIFPVIEALNTKIREKYYEKNKKNWEEFEKDTNNLLDNYHELLGILKMVKNSELGEVNQALNNLRSKTKDFLESYDKDKNGTIDIPELKDQRSKLGIDLTKENQEDGSGSSQLGNIIATMKNLEEKLVNYRQGTTSEANDNSPVTQLEEEATGVGNGIGLQQLGKSRQYLLRETHIVDISSASSAPEEYNSAILVIPKQ